MSVTRALKRQVRRMTVFVSSPSSTPGRVRLITRKGFDLAERFPLAAAAIAALPARSCIVDGEAIACDATGLKGLLRREQAGIAFNRPSIWKARSFTGRPARSVARASCRSGLAHPISPAGTRTP
jgi:hypothetical protein